MSSGSDTTSSYLSPVMSMSVAKPVSGTRAKRSADSFEDFDMNKKVQVSHVIQYEYRKLWWKNQVPENAVPEVESESVIAAVGGNSATFKVKHFIKIKKKSKFPKTFFSIIKICILKGFAEKWTRAGLL